MRTQTFGVELEMTGITRKRAAEVAAEYFGTSSEYIGSGYDKYAAKDGTGRLWCFVSDSSIRVERGRNGEGQQVEMVTPILHYDDIELLQELIRRLRKAGTKTNSSCGIHRGNGQIPLFQFHAPRRQGQGLHSILLSDFSPSDNAKVTMSDNEKYTFRCWLLRMGLIGDEFAVCRRFMLERLTGDIAWRYGQSA